MPKFTPAQLEALEKMLGMPVPESYVRYIDGYPPKLAEMVYSGDHLVGDYELFSDPDTIARENTDAREKPVWGPEAEDDWGATHLAIGKDLSGDMIFIDVAANNANKHEVQRYLCASGEEIVVAKDVETYGDKLLNDRESIRRS